MKKSVQLLDTHPKSTHDQVDPCFLPLFMIMGLWGGRGNNARIPYGGAAGRYGGYGGGFPGRGGFGYYSPFAMRREAYGAGMGGFGRGYGYGPGLGRMGNGYGPGMGMGGLGRFGTIF